MNLLDRTPHIHEGYWVNIIEVKIRITSYSTFAPLRFYKRFRMLTLGWTDGATFIPIEFSLLSSKKSQINGISKTQHKIRV